MKRVIFKFTNGEHINLPADYINLENGVYSAYNGENVVAYARQDFVDAVYLSEQKGEQK